MQAKAHLDGDALRALHVDGILLHQLLHAQGGVAGPHGMILMRQRRAKESHNAVAQHLIHRAFVVMHRLHHASEYRVKELPGCLGIAVGKQLHRAFEVGK
jgi:hypothetical protein